MCIFTMQILNLTVVLATLVLAKKKVGMSFSKGERTGGDL